MLYLPVDGGTGVGGGGGTAYNCKNLLLCQSKVAKLAAFVSAPSCDTNLTKSNHFSYSQSQSTKSLP